MSRCKKGLVYALLPGYDLFCFLERRDAATPEGNRKITFILESTKEK